MSEAGHDRKKVAEWNIRDGTWHQATRDPTAIRLWLEAERESEPLKASSVLIILTLTRSCKNSTERCHAPDFLSRWHLNSSAEHCPGIRQDDFLRELLWARTASAWCVPACSTRTYVIRHSPITTRGSPLPVYSPPQPLICPSLSSRHAEQVP